MQEKIAEHEQQLTKERHRFCLYDFCMLGEEDLCPENEYNIPELEEPEVPEFDPGPEVDDEGGMSEHRANWEIYE